MNLILWRHADAEEMSERASDIRAGDMSRPLTQRGRKQAKAIAEWLAARLDPHAQIRVSPAVRAVETAQALSDQFQIVRELSPGADVSAVLAAAGWPDGLGGASDTVIVVGHQPTLGRVASLLLSGTEANWALRKGGVWWLSNRRREDDAQVVLRAVINPDLVG